MSEFIEHFYNDNGYVTDIWYNPKTLQYTSVISDLEPVTFSTLREIKLFLKGYPNEK